MDANICPRGYYCPIGTEVDTQFPCPKGQLGLDEGLTGVVLLYSIYRDN